MKRVRYLVLISKDSEIDWGASVPGRPGCVATGKTIDSALRRIEQAIALHLRGMRKDGIKIPVPRSVPSPRARRHDAWISTQP